MDHSVTVNGRAEAGERHTTTARLGLLGSLPASVGPSRRVAHTTGEQRGVAKNADSTIVPARSRVAQMPDSQSACGVLQAASPSGLEAKQKLIGNGSHGRPFVPARVDGVGKEGAV